MRKIAIISFNHEESSLCLAKYIGLTGILVDYYYVNSPSHKGKVPGFEFKNKYNKWGMHKLEENDAPEIFQYMNNSLNSINLITYNGCSRRYTLFRLDRFILWLSCLIIRKRHYDAINIVGQVKEVEYCHNYLNGENIIHTYHEIGSHQNNIPSTPSVDVSVRDHSRVILHCQTTYYRYIALPGVEKQKVTVIPFGKFETSKLYVKPVELMIPLDLDKPTFLFFGAIKPYKGLNLLRKAMEHLLPLQDRFNLIIAGSGKDDNIAYFQSLPNCFVLNRFLENDEMMYLIQKSTVIVLPYHTASQTGIIPTIALYDKPCIATAVGAFPEMINDGGNGLLIEPENYFCFADAMKKCIEDKQFLARLQEGMSNYGNGDRYDWKTIAKQTLDFFNIN